MSDEPSDRRQLAIRIADSVTDAESLALRMWASKLLEIRASNLPAAQKAKLAISTTRQSEVIWPTVKIVAKELKRLTWDDRGLAGRMGLGGAAIGMAVFGGQGAGIAALGTAIGVPLWVVLGSGAAFAGVLYDELTKRPSSRHEGVRTTYKVIEAERED